MLLESTASGATWHDLPGPDSAQLGDDWRAIGPGMNALSKKGITGWAVGPKGRVARFVARQTGGP